jgi:hypothetical protein
MFPAAIQFDRRYSGKDGTIRHIVGRGDRSVDYQPGPERDRLQLAVRMSLMEFAAWAQEEHERIEP